MLLSITHHDRERKHAHAKRIGDCVKRGSEVLRQCAAAAAAAATAADPGTVPCCVVSGVPHLLRQKWAAVAAELQAAVQLAPFSNRVVRLAAEDEAAVAPLLDTLAAEWGGELAIGSYPVSCSAGSFTGCTHTHIWGGERATDSAREI